MTQCIHSNAAEEVQIFFALAVVQLAALACTIRGVIRTNARLSGRLVNSSNQVGRKYLERTSLDDETRHQSHTIRAVVSEQVFTIELRTSKKSMRVLGWYHFMCTASMSR